MKLTIDYHTHTVFSDGKNRAAEIAAAAKEHGLEGIAISEHGYSHLAFGIRRKKTERWLSELKKAQEEVGIRVLAGIESNIRGISGLCDLRESDYENFDVYLAGIHVATRYERLRDYKFGVSSMLRTKLGIGPSSSLVRDTTKAYIHAVERNPLDVVTHLNYLCFSDPVEVAKCCRDYGTYLEISSKKQHLSDEELAAVVATGVRFVVNSDAHTPDRVGDTRLAEEQIARVGVPLERIDNIDGRHPVFRFAEFKRHM